MKSLYQLLWFVALSTLACACSRQALLPIEPLALRVPAYRSDLATSQPISPLLGQLALLPALRPVVPTVPVASTAADFYEPAYQELAKMLDDRYPLSFKRAVFLTENAYLDNKLSYEDFSKRISMLAQAD